MASSIDFDLDRHDPLRSHDCDSNMIILPAKRKKNKSKCAKQVNIKRNLRSNKSQKRRMSKMEEEKERAFLLKTSIENFMKYKITDNAYSLLHSSSYVGQVETMAGRRQRPTRHIKATDKTQDDYYSWKTDTDSVSLDNGCNYEKEGIAEIEVGPEIFHSKASSEYTVSTPCQVHTGDDVSDLSIRTPSSSGAMATRDDKGNHVAASLCSEQEISLKSAGGRELYDDQSVVLQVEGSLGKQSPMVLRVERPHEIEEKRKDLPIVMMEQEIVEAIDEHHVTIISGETGCGKTTQVPQFLYEAGYGLELSSCRRGMVGVTQPRRVAVIATAKRVAFELGINLGEGIGFQVRHDKKTGERCSIKFMTDGILLREIQSDILLKRYSVIILDEAHERSLNTDILIGMLSRVIQLRQEIFNEQKEKLISGQGLNADDIVYPLKLVLMSATMQVESFGSRLFNEPPVIEVPTRQFPVTIHFSRRTEEVDYIGQAYKKVLSIHKRLPAGGILVFLTGRKEVEYLCDKLRSASKKLAKTDSEISSASNIDADDISEEFDAEGYPDLQSERYSWFDDDMTRDEDLLSASCIGSGTDSESDVGAGEDVENDCHLEGILGEHGSIASLKASFEALEGGTKMKDSTISAFDKTNHKQIVKKQINTRSVALRVLPLYAMLRASLQLRVFEEVNEGERLVVVATNVAETSLTIPGIKYVVDTGREKVKHYNPKNGIETYEIQWISKASAAQRSGRAGRTGPGYCYRLYSPAAFGNCCPEFSVPEICKIPVDGIVLIMKSMGISKVANFPFPTPPQKSTLIEAERCLRILQAIDDDGNLTPLGKAMAWYPMNPHHSRMLLIVIQIIKKLENYPRGNLVLAYAIAVAASLSSSDPFIAHFSAEGDPEKSQKKKLKEAAKASRARFSNASSDTLSVAYALQCFEVSENRGKFCNENMLHLKTLEEMSKLRKQILQIVCSTREILHEFTWDRDTIEEVELAWRACSIKYSLLFNEEEILRQAICAGWADRVARRVRSISGRSKNPRTHSVRYQSSAGEEPVFLHRSSSLCTTAPEYIVYKELLHTNRSYMHGATSVKPEWLVLHAKSLCVFSPPLPDPKPFYEPVSDELFHWVIPTFGPHNWQLPLCSIRVANDTNRIMVFAYALLRGDVLPCLRSVQEYMATAPTAILRLEMLGQRRVGNLLSELKVHGETIDSCSKLRDAWKNNPLKLHSEILDWFQQSLHSRFNDLWSQMHLEIQLDPRERFPKKAKRSKNAFKLFC